MTLRIPNCKRLPFFAYVFWVALISIDSLNQVALAQQPSEPQVKSVEKASTRAPDEFRPPRRGFASTGKSHFRALRRHAAGGD